MAQGDIFYSSVDQNLQDELRARAQAGFSDRETKDLDYMLGKVANVEIRAYDGPIASKSNLAKTLLGDAIDPMASIGGKNVRAGSYMPSTPKSGYLVDSARPGYKIPPVITTTEIQFGDAAMALTWKASINVTITDPTADLENFERIWLRPGRKCSVIIEYPDSAVITKKRLTEFTSYTTGKLKDRYGEDAGDIKDKLNKLNHVRFDGLLTSFTFTYNLDGSIECTMLMTGATNVYTDLTMIIKPDPKNPNTTTTFYSAINEKVNRIKNRQGGTDFEYVPDPARPDRSIIWGQLYDPGYKTKKQNRNTIQDIHTYVSLGWLIDELNTNIVDKLNENKVVNQARVICDETVCRSQVYSEITSADPRKILLWEGTSDSTVTTYPINPTTLTETFTIETDSPPLIMPDGSEEPIDPVVDSIEIDTFVDSWKLLMDVDPKTPGFHENNQAYPSRIYIGLETVIKPILDDPNIKTVNDFLKSITGVISKYTGNSMRMALITHPIESDKLLYYNSKYYGSDVEVSGVNAAAFVIPMFARDNLNDMNLRNQQPGKHVGSVVYEAKISSKLPEDLSSLSYTLNLGPEISEHDIGPFMSFMYAEGTLGDPTTQKGKLALEYKRKHKKYKDELATSKAVFMNNPTSTETIERLRISLLKYMQFPTDDITKSNKLLAPFYPFDVELTLDGINGFRWGDVMIVPALPNRFRKHSIFSILNVTHTVDAQGQWSTKLKLIMRPDIQP